MNEKNHLKRPRELKVDLNDREKKSRLGQVICSKGFKKKTSKCFPFEPEDLMNSALKPSSYQALYESKNYHWDRKKEDVVIISGQNSIQEKMQWNAMMTTMESSFESIQNMFLLSVWPDQRFISFIISLMGNLFCSPMHMMMRINCLNGAFSEPLKSRCQAFIKRFEDLESRLTFLSLSFSTPMFLNMPQPSAWGYVYPSFSYVNPAYFFQPAQNLPQFVQPMELETALSEEVTELNSDRKITINQ